MFYTKTPTIPNIAGDSISVVSFPNLGPNFDHSLESDKLGYARIKSSCKFRGVF